MKILVTSLSDLMRIPPQRPHHLIDHLVIHHDVSVRSVRTTWGKGINDEFNKNLLQRVDFGYLTQNYHHPLLQEGSVYLKPWLRKWISSQGFDLHINLNSLIAGYGIARILHSTGTPTIIDICDDLPERFSLSPHVPKVLRSPAKAVARHLMQKNIGIASRITYSGDPMRTAYGFPALKSHLLPNGVDCHLFQPLPGEEIRNELGIRDDDFVCGFVGVMSDWTALDMVIGAIGRLNQESPGFKFLVVGDGEQLPYLKKLVGDSGISSYVIFTGRVPYRKVPLFMAAMDVGLIPLKPTVDCQHAHPMKLFEYMACEKPVIATPLEGVCSISGDRILYAGSQEELMGKVHQLAKDDDLRTFLGKQGRAFVKAHYTWDHIFTRFDDVLWDVMHEEVSAH